MRLLFFSYLSNNFCHQKLFLPTEKVIRHQWSAVSCRCHNPAQWHFLAARPPGWLSLSGSFIITDPSQSVWCSKCVSLSTRSEPSLHSLFIFFSNHGWSTLVLSEQRLLFIFVRAFSFQACSLVVRVPVFDVQHTGVCPPNNRRSQPKHAEKRKTGGTQTRKGSPSFSITNWLFRSF